MYDTVTALYVWKLLLRQGREVGEGTVWNGPPSLTYTVMYINSDIYSVEGSKRDYV